MYTQAPQVPHDRWDESTINPNLPHGNDVWPQLRLPPNVNGEMAGQAVIELRTLAQSRLGSTPLHNLAYNLLSQNHFNNSTFTEWCQRAVDFTEFLMVAQPHGGGSPVSKAVQKLYFGFLAVTGGTYPNIVGMLRPEVAEALNQSGAELRDILYDIQQFQQQGRRPPTPQYGGQQQAPASPPTPWAQNPMGGNRGGQLPPVQPGGMGSHGYGYNAPRGPVGNMSPTPYQPSGGQMAGQYNTPVGEGPRPTGGRYADEPVESWNATQPTEKTGPADWMRGYVTPEPSRPVPEDDAKAPLTVDDVDMNPWETVPTGVTIDPKRSFDHFYNPGGVEIKPAHSSGWVRTTGHTRPYAQGYDPKQHCMFHVKWPDGVVEEKLTEWSHDMNYLKHELNDALRGMKLKPTGRVVASTHSIVDYDQLPESTDKQILETVVKGPLDTQSEVTPVVLDTLFSTSSELENEQAARANVIAELHLDESTTNVPAYEYVSGKLYPIMVSETTERALLDLVAKKSHVVLADGLRHMAESGDLAVRYYRFINDRLTTAFNGVLRDNLSMGNLTMDSYADDVEEMVAHIRVKYGAELVTVINSQTQAFLKRHLNLAFEAVDEADVVEGEEPERQQLCLFEECVNLQTRWSVEEIASVGLTNDEAVLISETSHSHLWEVMLSMIARNKKAENLPHCSLRLITADGVYYEVLRGWLVQDSVLLKKIK